MGLTLAVELWADWSSRRELQFLWLYNVFVIVEYGLLCWYFWKISGSWLKKYILLSIPVFAAISVVVSIRLYGFNKYPGQNINIEGMLLTVICAGVLFNLDSKVHASIIRHPDFWICCGWLIFCTGTFLSNGLLTYLMSLDHAVANRVFEMINHPLNLVLYTCLTLGFICAIPRK